MSTAVLNEPGSQCVLPVARDRPMELSLRGKSTPHAPIAPPEGQDVGQTFWVETIEDVTQLEKYIPAWDELAAGCSDPNPFYESWMLLPAWKAFGHEVPGTMFALVWKRDPRPKQPACLIGFVPLIPRRLFGFIPLRYRRVWQHTYCYLCSPLARRGWEQEALGALLDWSVAEGQGLLKLRHLSAEGPFSQALIDLMRERGAAAFVVERYNRAFMRPKANYEEYILHSMTNHARQELRRQQRRLGALGRLETRVLSDNERLSNGGGNDVEPWLRQFLELEASGWKGREQTAIGSDQVSREYFETICREAHSRNRLMMLGMFLDDRPIAMKCNFLAGDGSYAFKIAFDEAYSKYSPGVLLEAENIRVVHEMPQIKWMDSCALPGHPMINRLWSERRTIQKVLVSPGRWIDNSAVDVATALFAVRRIFKWRSPAGTGANAPNKEKKGGSDVPSNESSTQNL